MTADYKRRGGGEGTLFWEEPRQRWVASASVGYNAAGRRVRKKATGRTKTEARSKLKAMIRDYEDGLAIGPDNYTVGDAVREWMQFPGGNAGESTRETNRHLCEGHILPLLGARKLRELTADDVDKWLAGRAEVLATSSLGKLHSALNRSVKRAMARDKVKRNVVELCSVPQGRVGRPSKALTFAQAESVLSAVETSPMGAYIIVSMLTGARTEELRALTWDHVDLVGKLKAVPPVPPHMAVWRSVRVGGDTKTKKSRRTLALPDRCIDALKVQRVRQDGQREKAGDRWIDLGLVFTTRYGTPLDAADVRREFRTAIRPAEGITPGEWTPREMRHSFVSLLSDQGVPIEHISQLVGHKNTTITELIYRKQIRPVIQDGAVVMNRVFGAAGSQNGSQQGESPAPVDETGL